MGFLRILKTKSAVLLILGFTLNVAMANQSNVNDKQISGNSFAANCDLGIRHWGGGQPGDCQNGYHNVIRFSCCANVDSEGNWATYARDYVHSLGHGYPPINPGAARTRDPACYKKRGFRATICIPN